MWILYTDRSMLPHPTWAPETWATSSRTRWELRGSGSDGLLLNWLGKLSDRINNGLRCFLVPPLRDVDTKPATHGLRITQLTDLKKPQEFPTLKTSRILKNPRKSSSQSVWALVSNRVNRNLNLSVPGYNSSSFCRGVDGDLHLSWSSHEMLVFRSL